MNPAQTKIRKILRTGVEKPAAKHSKYIFRSNFINLSILILIVIFGVVFYLLGARRESLLMILVFSLFVPVFYFNSKKQYTTANLWQLVCIALCVFYYGTVFGRAASVHYLFFVFVTLPFYLFSSRQYAPIALVLMLYFALFYVMELELVTLPVVLDESGQQVMRFLMVTLVLLWLTANYLYFERTSRQAEEKLRDANKKLVQQNKELEQFAYIASHDLQEPLLTITNFTELLNIDYNNKLDAEGRLYLRYLSESSVRMRRLVKGLLDYCRLGHNHSAAGVDFNAVVAHVLQDMQATIKATGAVITVGELPAINAHETEIRLLFQNLISNAIKFRKKEGVPEIQVFAEKLAGRWKFTVADNGIGMEKKNLDKIFTIFQRLHNRNDYEGAGIGLAHCRKIAELHGGEIWAESEPGSGSAFHFTIPDKQLI